MFAYEDATTEYIAKISISSISFESKKKMLEHVIKTLKHLQREAKDEIIQLESRQE